MTEKTHMRLWLTAWIGAALFQALAIYLSPKKGKDRQDGRLRLMLCRPSFQSLPPCG